MWVKYVRICSNIHITTNQIGNTLQALHSDQGNTLHHFVNAANYE